MEHPLITDVDKLTLEQLSDRVTDLGKKLTIAQRTGNGHLCNQIRMALETFRNRYQTKLEESYKKQEELNNINFDDKITVSPPLTLMDL